MPCQQRSTHHNKLTLSNTCRLVRDISYQIVIGKLNTAIILKVDSLLHCNSEEQHCVHFHVSQARFTVNAASHQLHPCMHWELTFWQKLRDVNFWKSRIIVVKSEPLQTPLKVTISISSEVFVSECLSSSNMRHFHIK